MPAMMFCWIRSWNSFHLTLTFIYHYMYQYIWFSFSHPEPGTTLGGSQETWDQKLVRKKFLQINISLVCAYSYCDVHSVLWPNSLGFKAWLDGRMLKNIYISMYSDSLVWTFVALTQFTIPSWGLGDFRFSYDCCVSISAWDLKHAVMRHFTTLLWNLF